MNFTVAILSIIFHLVVLIACYKNLLIIHKIKLIKKKKIT